MPDSRPLSQQRTAHALRHFILCGALWAMYGPNATPSGSIFSGFALHIGLSEAQIAFLVGLSSLAGATELVSFYLTRRIANKRRWMVMWGQLEIVAASAVVLVGLSPEPLRLYLVAGLLVFAYLIGHTVNPHFSSWLSNVIPEEVRATYIGRRMFVLTVTSMVYLLVASQAIDRLPKPLGFYAVFAWGCLSGLAGYYLLFVTPYPDTSVPESPGFARSLLEPLRNRSFALLALFLCVWNIAAGLASALYGVYMIKYLGLSYSRIAIYSNITLALMVVGYLASGALAQRHGSRPLAQILIVPGMVATLLWALMTQSNCAVLLPIVCAVNGLASAGISVALGSLLYRIVPQGVENSAYFANWTGLSAAAAALGPFVAGLLRRSLPDHLVIMGQDFNSLQVIFGIGGLLYALPLVVSLFIVEPEAASPRYVLGQFRGNLLSFAYNFALYNVARDNESRAEALRRLGRSRTPLAVTPLMKGLGHVSHEVRSKAARGLGEGQFEEAVEPLKQALEDEQSDIRPEAAEALGKIGHHAVAEPLMRALEDADLRVRQSAALALGEVGGERAADALLAAIRGPFDRALFPTLVEAASRRHDLRLVEPILQGLTQLQLPVIRMQVINGVCRVLGERNHFYRLATAEPLQRAGLREPMMQRIVRLLSSPRVLLPDRVALRATAVEAAAAAEADDLPTFTARARAIADQVLALEASPPVARHAAQAINLYMETAPAELLAEEGMVFLVIALTALARSLAGKHADDARSS